MRKGIAACLKRLLESGEIAEFYDNRSDTDKFMVGFVAAVDEDDFLVQMIAPNGLDDGFSVAHIEDTAQIVEGSRYLHKVLALYRHSGEAQPLTVLPRDARPMEWLFRYAIETARYVSVELAQSGKNDVCGRVISFDGDVAQVEERDEYGAADGIATFAREEITGIVCDSEDERRVRLLTQIVESEGISF